VGEGEAGFPLSRESVSPSSSPPPPACSLSLFLSLCQTNKIFFKKKMVSNRTNAQRRYVYAHNIYCIHGWEERAVRQGFQRW